MRNRKWMHRVGSVLIGTALSMGAMPVSMAAPVFAQEGEAAFEAVGTSSNQNQMVSDPEIVSTNVVGVSSERTVNFNENWKFTLSDPSGAQNNSHDDSKWSQINLPHDYSLSQDYSGSMEAESGYKPGGVGWYRKAFTLDSSALGKQVVVEFNGVYMDATVYINGHNLGNHPYGYTGFAFDLTDYLTEGENVIAVRVNHQTPSSRWYSGSGIYRDVNLTITDAVHADYNGIQITTPTLAQNQSQALTRAVTKVRNDGDKEASVTVRQSVLDGENVLAAQTSAAVAVAAGSTQSISADVTVDSPTLWSIETPKLYTLKTEVLVDGEVADTVNTTFGYRYYSFDRNTGFKLNGKNVKLKGVCMHHDQGALGAEANDRAIERQVQILKKMGCNSIRVTHNPADPALLEACSREGIVVINELFDGWTAAKNGNYNDYARFFNVSVPAGTELLGLEAGDTWSKFDTRAAVEESRNEASVIMYSLGNEIFEGTGGMSNTDTIAETLVSQIRTRDEERIVTFGGNKLKGGAGSSEDPVANVISSHGGVVGYNYASGANYDNARTIHPDWTIVGSETASHVNSRGVYTTTASNSLNSDKLLTSYDYSAVGWGATASSAWYEVIIRDFVAGEYVWTGFDYIGEPTPNNGTGAGWVNGSNSPKNSFFGIVDTAGLPKDNYYLYQSLWNDDVNTLHVLPAWNRDTVLNNGNGNVPVVVYSDAASVELFITPTGGTRTSLGKKTFTKHTTDAGFTYQLYEGDGKDSAANKNLYLTWNVPYQEGKLEAVAYDEANNVITKTEGRSVVETTGAAEAIDLEADRTTIKGDGTDLSYITINIEDAQGRIVPSAKNSVTVKVEGAGTLAGMDNGVQPDHQSYQDDNRKAQAGQLVAIVRSNGQAGEIKVTASADGLTSRTITLNAEEVETAEKEGLVSFEYSRNYYVKTGTLPELPATIKANYSDGTSKNVSVTWNAVTPDQVAEPGSFGVSGTAEGNTVSVVVNVIDNVSSLLNVSTVVPVGTVPTLPTSRPAVLNDGTVMTSSFEINWQMPENSVFDSEGTVEIPGTAELFGQQVPVKATVRVTNADTVLKDSVTGAANLTTTIPAGSESDTLDAIKDGNTVFDPSNKNGDDNLTCWTNYNYCFNNPENNTASITFRYDTQQMIGQIKVHFTNDTWSATYPEAGTTTFEVSEDGVDWKPLSVKETIGDAVDSYNKPYTYEIAPTMFTYLRMNITNSTQKKGNNNPCTGIAEVELFGVETSMTVNTAAELSSMSIGGKEISATMLSGKTITTAENPGSLELAAKDNGAITVLPVENSTQVVLVQSEDGQSLTKYTIQYGVVNPNDDSRDIPVEKLSANAGSAQSGQGAGNALDGDDGTLWHSSWSGAPRENLWIEFDIDGDYLVDGLRLLPRQSQTNGLITKYRIDVQDESGAWKTVSEGDWDQSNAWKLVRFSPVQTKKVRLTAVDSITDTAAKQYASAAEIRLTGTETSGETPVVPAVLDYTLLKAAITKASSLNVDDFFDGDARTALGTALDDARAIDDKAENQDQINAAAAKLNTALLGLRLTPSAEKLEALK